jgi:hypothetical protein
MRPYDPERAPDVDDWLGADEQERIEAVRIHHKKAGEQVPNLGAHAIIHAIVETQIAMKAVGVQETFDRLRADGLDRHDTIHAIGWVLSSVLEATIRDAKSFQGVAPNDAYIKALKDLSADKWRRAT